MEDNRFTIDETESKEEILHEVKAEPRRKYVVNLRLNGELEEEIRRAAYDTGLPITKFIEMAVREKLKRMKEKQ